VSRWQHSWPKGKQVIAIPQQQIEDVGAVLDELSTRVEEALAQSNPNKKAQAAVEIHNKMQKLKTAIKEGRATPKILEIARMNAMDTRLMVEVFGIKE